VSVYDGRMDESDEQLIEAILTIVDQAGRRAAGRRQAAGGLAEHASRPHYRLYWLAISDLGADTGFVRCEFPPSTDRFSVPTFVKRLVTAEPGASDLRTGRDEDVYESFGNLFFPDEMRLHNAYRKLVAEAEDDLLESDAIFQYVEIEAWLCDPPEPGGAADRGMAERMYGVQLWAGSAQTETLKLV